MHAKSRIIVAALIMLLSATAGVLLAIDSLAAPDHDAPAEEFQRLVGGLGFGPAVDLSRCEFSFDPRLCPDCPQQHGPSPGGVYFCPQHACSILYYPPMRPAQLSVTKGEDDGRSP